MQSRNFPQRPHPSPFLRPGGMGVAASVLMAALTAVLASLCVPLALHAEDAPMKPELKISAVQLYTGQAMVRRQATVELRPGMNELQVDDLPGALLDDSLRVAVAGEGVKLEEIRVETEHRRVYRTEEAREAEDLLRKAESRLRSLTDRYSALREEEAILLKIQAGPAPLKEEHRTLEPSRWEAILDFQQNALRKNHELTEKVLEEIDGAREEVAVALAVAERHRSERSLSIKRLNVSLTHTAKSAEKRELTLEYRIGGASWFPIYSARVMTASNSDRARVRLAAYALVKNETGEDWDHVRLAFSAADPDESARLPMLAEWHIKPVLTEVSADRTPGSRVAREDESRRGPPAPSQKRKESPAMQRIIQQEERDVVAEIPEENAPAKPVPLSKKQDLARQKLDTQTNRTRDYFAKNNEVVSDERARQKTERVQTVLGGVRENAAARDRALQSGNYDEALNRSEQVLENIRNLDSRYQKFFKDEEDRSILVKRQSLEMLDARRFTSRLINPLQSGRGFDYRYEIGQREDVRSDGAFRKVFLFEKELDAGLFYESVPAQKPLAFLVGETRHSEAVPLLAGPVSVFHNKDYVGEGSLPSVSSKEPFLLHLGADEEIKLDRTERSFRETEGLLSRTYVYRYEIVLTVKNRRRSPSTVVVLDRLPVPSDERIKITDVSIEPQANVQKNDYGQLVFRLNLAPGEERKLRIVYRLSHPADTLPVFREGSSPRL